MTHHRAEHLLLAVGMLVAGSVFITTAGCSSNQSALPPLDMGSPDDPDPNAMYAVGNNVKFLDNVQSNREDDGTVSELEFVNSDGESVQLAQYIDRNNVLLVFTRGFSGQICPFCTTQTSRLIANHEKFGERDTEVLLVYPGQTEQLDEFRAASTKAHEKDTIPFPVLLDTELKAVMKLKIEAQLAHPSTFIIDKKGNVAFSYVGTSPTDRPSIKALLAQLDKLQG